MSDVALHTIEICAGVGMLGEGLRAGLAHLGIETRTVCFVEREAYPASVLAARMEEGSLDQAPVWSDLLTFDARRWDGAVDGIVAGFPCQDLSLAGKRAGLDGKRSGLFFNILDIADRSGAWFLFLENVAGIASATASVVDEAEGALEERAAARVLGELADRGWNAEWLTLSASDVGASHGRERWFCLAWRMGHHNDKRAHRSRAGTEQDGSAKPAQSSGQVGHAGLQHQHLQQRHEGAEPAGADGGLAHAPQHGRYEGRPESSGEQGRSDAAERGGAMANSERPCDRAQERTSDCGRDEEAKRSADQHGGLRGACVQAMADTCSPGLPQRIRGGELREQPTERDPGPDLELRGRPFFAPGPADPDWAGIIQREPYLAPALEPDFRGDVDGMAFAMDESRAQRLKCIGNGVVALQAAAAFVELARRAGLLNLKGTES